MPVDHILGELPAGWQYLSLGEACLRGGGNIQTGPFGSQLHASDYVESGIPSIMPQNIGDNRIIEQGIARVRKADAVRLSRYRVEPGDIIYSRRGDVERRALIRNSEDGWLCGTGCLRVRLGQKGAVPQFTAFYLGHPRVREWIVRHAHGATMPNLNTSILCACPFIWPPLDEQQAIASILGSLDDKIDLNRRMNETLESMARSIFKDWFVDFGPTRAKMEGRAPYLAPEIWELFPDRLDEEGKPEGWSWGTLADYSRLNPESWSRTNYPDVIKYVDLSGAKWGVIYNAQKYIKADAPSRAQRILRVGDTIVGTVRPGNGSYAFVGKDGFTGSTGFAVLRPLQEYLHEFTYLCATSPANIDRLAHLADGGAYPAVRPEVVLETDAVVANLSALKAFNKLIRPLVERVEVNKSENVTLAQTRDLLLPKLMSGEIRVKDAEKAVESVL